MRNKNGPNIDPCGTPQEMCVTDDVVPKKYTCLRDNSGTVLAGSSDAIIL